MMASEDISHKAQANGGMADPVSQCHFQKSAGLAKSVPQEVLKPEQAAKREKLTNIINQGIEKPEL